MEKVEDNIFVCKNHTSLSAESKCKTCKVYLCDVCSLDHEHEIITLKEEAITFARAVITGTFPPKTASTTQANPKTKFEEIRMLHEEFTTALSQAREALEIIGVGIETEMGKLNARITATAHLENWNDEQTKALQEELKKQMIRKEYGLICNKKEELTKAFEDFNLLHTTNLDEMKKRMAKYKASIAHWMNAMLSPVTAEPEPEPAQARPEKQEEEAPDGVVESRPVNISPQHYVGRFQEGLILYDVQQQRKQIVNFSGVEFHDCCEGVEARGSIFMTGGRNDDKTTYELKLSGIQWTFVSRADMKTGRCNHAICQSADTYIYCGGGVSDRKVIKKVERFDIEANSWQELAPLNEARQNACMAALDNRYLFFIGGGKLGHTNLTNVIECLDTTKSDGWEVLSPRLGCKNWRPCECLNAVAISSNEILILGGWVKKQEPRAKCYIYNHSTKRLKKLPNKLGKNVPFFYRITPIIYNKHVYVMSPNDDVHVYSIEEKTFKIIEAEEWNKGVALDTKGELVLVGRVKEALWVYDVIQHAGDKIVARNYKIGDCAECVQVNGLIYAVGGENESKKTVTYDIRNFNGEVEFKADLNTGRQNHGLAQANNQYIFCAAGVTERTVTNHCEKYNVANNVWTVIAHLNEEKQNVSLCVCNENELYCIGGGQINRKNLHSTIERLQFNSEDSKWEIITLDPNPKWKPIECLGSFELAPNQILVFGGWKRKREESGRVFIFDIIRRTVVRTAHRMVVKTGFYYAIGPIIHGNMAYIMDPEFHIHSVNRETHEWAIIRASTWKPAEKKQSSEETRKCNPS